MPALTGQVKGMRKTVLLVLVVFLVAPAMGDDDSIYAPNHEFKEKKWKEGALELPALPKDRNLIELRLPHSRVRIFFDQKSISVGKDGVVRYTVIIQSRSGVRNTLYEGIRCDTREYKTFAYSANKQNFREMRRAYWHSIRGQMSFKYREILADLYMCHLRTTRNKVADIIRILKNQPDVNASPDEID